jgi:hypothetical protein
MQNLEGAGGRVGCGSLSQFSTRLTLLAAFCLLASTLCRGQQPTPPQGKQAEAPASPPVGAETSESPPPGDWAPELLDAILSSPNEEAQESLYHAAFAVGPSLVPPLAEALGDDRTAEFAAASLAFIGGQMALETLWKLLSDPRDLNLRRFCYGALGEYDSSQATNLLFDVINKSDTEPDRTVTEAAILALTVRSDSALPPRIREAETKIKDVVIHDDLDNALAVIEGRAKYLASPDGKKAGGSIEEAVRTYFIAALEPPPPSKIPPPPADQKPLAKSPPASRAPAKPEVSFEIRRLTLSPDKSRALAQVVFEDPTAAAYYEMVLQKRAGNWTVASVWLGPEVEKPGAPVEAAPSRDE